MTKTMPHQWTDADGYVLLVKCVNADMTSYRGFVWPTEGPVRPINWSREPDCDSGGLFGWPWGMGIGDGKEPTCPVWLVFRAKPKNVILVGDGPKAKAVPGDDGELPEVVFCGGMVGAVMHCMPGRLEWSKKHSKKTFATGDGSSSAATGYGSSSAATGDRSSSAANGYGSSSAANGYRSSSAANGYGSSSAATGYGSSSAANGDGSSSACVGDQCFAYSGGRAKVGPDGALVIRWWDTDAQRYRFAFGEVGGRGKHRVEPDTWYVVVDGKLTTE